jgi:hypothetical protein
MRCGGIVAPVWCQGVITMQEVLRDVEPTMTLISYLTENTMCCDEKERHKQC